MSIISAQMGNSTGNSTGNSVGIPATTCAGCGIAFTHDYILQHIMNECKPAEEVKSYEVKRSSELIKAYADSKVELANEAVRIAKQFYKKDTPTKEETMNPNNPNFRPEEEQMQLTNKDILLAMFESFDDAAKDLKHLSMMFEESVAEFQALPEPLQEGVDKEAYNALKQDFEAVQRDLQAYRGKASMWDHVCNLVHQYERNR